MNIFSKSMLAMLAAASMASCGNAAEEKAPAAQNQSQNAAEAVIDNIMSRRSIRRYTDQAVPRELLDTILMCGLNAPNGRNAQEYEVRVVADSASVAFLHENIRGLYNAPAYIFIANGASYNSSLIDVGLLSGNIGLSAWSLGLGTVNLGGPVGAMKENPELMAKLAFSEGYDLCLALALGYPDEAPDAKPRNGEKVRFVEIAD